MIKEHELYTELTKQQYWDIALTKLSDKSFQNKEAVMEDLTDIVTTERKEVYIKAICNGTYEWVIPEKVEIAKAETTKKRIVYMYPPKERLLLGVLYRALTELTKDEIPENCFSYKRGVTTNSAIHYIRKYKKGSNLYGLKMDIASYFNSVLKEYLTQCLVELFGTDTNLYKTMSNLMLTDLVMYKGKEMDEYKSLIAGCALGSYFANYCLKDIDNHFKQLGVVYARYSDDILVMDETPEKINEHLAYIQEKIQDYGLTINPKKYVHFEPTEPVEYLGLSLDGNTIDISRHAKQKVKKQIKRWVQKGRREIEMEGQPFELVAKKLLGRLNNKLYKCYILDKSKYGWGIYVFRYITTTDSLREIDHYLRDQIRYLKTGKHNKHNWTAITEQEFQELGVVNLKDMYELYYADYDYYCERVYVL